MRLKTCILSGNWDDNYPCSYTRPKFIVTLKVVIKGVSTFRFVVGAYETAMQ